MSALAVLDLASAGLLLAMLAVAVYNLRTAPRLERAPAPARHPRVSLLLPARDEAENLREALPRLARLEYPALEVLVLDDGSTDATAAVVREHAARDPRLRLLTGAELPPGWLGKNWACHQLGAAAAGEVLVFCDADVSVGPEALRRTVGAMEHHDADVLTAIPRQRFGGWVERAVIPLVVHLPILALLPLRRVALSPAPSLSMANGQWLAFTREAYGRSGGHAAVRGEVIEDVAIGRRVKAAGLRLLPVLATDTLEVRMYRDARALRQGFGKNVYALLGSRPLPFAGAMAAFLLYAVYPWAALAGGRAGALLPLLLLLALRASGVAFFRHGWRSVLLHPAGALLTVLVAAGSAVGHYRGTLRWKDRPLAGAAGPAPAASPVAPLGPERARPGAAGAFDAHRSGREQW
jgi:glycosyltransferase involved in cell wall biosynthesis